MAVVTETVWREFISAHPDAHILQTAEWGAFKSHYGWYPKFFVHQDTGALVLFRRLPFKRTIAYIPKGPIGDDWETLLKEITETSRQEGAFLVYVEPDAWEDCPNCERLLRSGFSRSETSIQPRQTIMVSLAGDQDAWQQRMKQKTRYNIRLAEKKDVRVALSNDIQTFAHLMEVTGDRDEFGIHDASYYEQAYALFGQERDACALFMATYQDQPLAAIMVFRRGKRAWYFYGASNNQERNRMPTYLLQWEAMQWAAGHGVVEYDLWGIPDAGETELEENFTTRSDGLWGVYRFKRGFGGEIKRSAGVYEKVLNKPLYAAFQIALKFKKSLVS